MNDNEDAWFAAQRQERSNEIAQLQRNNQSHVRNVAQRKEIFENLIQRSAPVPRQENARGTSVPGPSMSSNDTQTVLNTVDTSSNTPPTANNNQLTVVDLAPAELDPNVSALDLELQQLLHTQRVSTVLGNFQFRRNLEQRLQSSLSSLPGISQPGLSSQLSLPSSVTTSSSASAPSTTAEGVNVEQMLNPDNDPELSALVNYHVVSNILQGAFRSHLESTIWTRYLNRVNNGAPGPIPNSLNSTGFALNLEDIGGGIGGGTERLSPSQTRLLYSMKTEISELRGMVQVLLQSQIETQRFVRNELSTALRAAAQGTLGQGQVPESVDSCCVCLNSMADTMVYACGHMCLCYPCSSQLRAQARGSTILCPVCRTPVRDIVRVFALHLSTDTVLPDEPL